MRERSQVTGAAQGTILTNHRMNVGIKHCRIGFCYDRTHAGAAGTQGRQTQKHKSANNFGLYLRTSTCGMGAHQGQLQLRAHLLRDVAARQRTKTSGDSVNRRRVLGKLFYTVTRGGNALQRFLGNLYLRAITRNGHDLLNAQGTDAHGHGGGIRIRH